MSVNRDYDKYYYKYKHRYMLLKGGNGGNGGNEDNKDNIFVNSKINIDELVNDLKSKYNVKIANELSRGGIYITDNYDDCERAVKLYDKVIILVNEKSYNGDLELCSITCESMKDLLDYLSLDDLKLGLSYLFDGNSGMRKLELHKKLRSWDIKYGIPELVDYVRQEAKHGKFDKELYGIKCVLRNFVDASTIYNIIDKQELYYTMRNAYDDYETFMPKTVRLDELKEIKDGDVFIIKPVGVGAHSGKGISVVVNDRELKVAKENAAKHKHWKWIASKYIKNPLLFNGKKFHFRCYLMITTMNLKKFYKFNQYEIVLAKDKYKPSDFQNKNIHDSHAKTTPFLYTYPKDIKDDRIQVEVEKIMDRIIDVLMKTNITGYEEPKYAYDILGLDIMFDDNYNAWLIEVNNKIGHGIENYNENYRNFEKNFLTWEYNSIVKQIFSKIKLVSMDKINDKQIDELLILTTNRDIMSHIGGGEVWDRSKILKLIEDAKHDKDMEMSKRRYFDWIVCLKYGVNKVVGYVSLRPFTKNKDNNLQVRIFTYPNMGYGTNIIRKIIKFIGKTDFKLWATIHKDNIGSLSFFRKLGWKYMNDIKIGSSVNEVYLYNN